MLRASRGLTIERIRAGRALRCALVFMLAGLTAAIVLGVLAAGQAWAIFRAFSPSSPWNHTAVPTASGNPYAGQFTDRPGLPIRLSGTPDTVTYAAPIYFAQPGDPTAPVVVTQRDWLPDGSTGWDGRPVPVPIGVRPAPGADGHLTVVSADRRTAWDFLGCTQAGPMGYVGRVIVQWNLNGPGYSTEDDETSARGSGAPLISSSLRAEEALNGIRHALGFTVPRVSSDYVWPATHSDGKQGPNAIKYGMRFVLRPDYPVSASAPVGVVNVIYALKTFGVYLVDQGADFEIDADFTKPELWQLAGLSSKTLDIQPSDLRPAELGTPPPIPMIVAPASTSSRPPTVRLRGQPAAYPRGLSPSREREGPRGARRLRACQGAGLHPGGVAIPAGHEGEEERPVCREGEAQAFRPPAPGRPEPRQAAPAPHPFSGGDYAAPAREGARFWPIERDSRPSQTGDPAWRLARLPARNRESTLRLLAWFETDPSPLWHGCHAVAAPPARAEWAQRLLGLSRALKNRHPRAFAAV